MRNLYELCLILLSAVICYCALLEFEFTLPKAFETPENGGGWFYEYQTLIAGLIATLGAGGTIIIIFLNHKELLNVKLISTKIHMRDALSHLSSECEHWYNAILDRECVEHTWTKTINIFKDNVGYLDKKSAWAVDRLTYYYQIYNSQMDRFNKARKNIRHTTVLERLYECVHFQCMINRMFDFARGNKPYINYIEKKNLPLEEMLSAYNSLGYSRSKGDVVKTQGIEMELEKLIIKRHGH